MIIKKDIPLFEYDDSSAEVIVPDHYHSGRTLPEKCLFAFLGDVVHRYAEAHHAEIAMELYNVSHTTKVYVLHEEKEDICLVQASVGAPAAVQILESVLACGVRKVIAAGSCGVLRELPENAFIVPVRALRAEGTSYHYLPASRYIDLDERPARAIEKCFEKHGLPFVTCTTWTTDGFFRETGDMVKSRLAEGCSVVEMECSALAACCRKRGAEFGQFLFTADSLANVHDYDARDFGTDSHEKALLLGLDVLRSFDGIPHGGTKTRPSESAVSTDLFRSDAHEEVTWDLIELVRHSEELRTLLEKSVRLAAGKNPDRDTNPVYDLESYYRFVDRCVRSMPWEICLSEKYDTLFWKIDQGMGCLYFVCNQPLEELADCGYYHNSLMYHEPFRSWFVRFMAAAGEFMNSERSWCDAYYRNFLQYPEFHLDDGTYEDPANWKTCNDFIVRRLSDPSKRPVASPEDDRIVVSPADAVPQGLWKIDGNSRVISNDETEQAGLSIKTGMLKDVSALLGKSRYAHAFRNGRLTHMFLDVYDYHRYHFPVSGTVKEVLLIPQDDAPGGVITWLPEVGRYKEFFTEIYGWQSIETRAAVIIETDSGGLCAVVPVGMCQVASVNFEDGVQPGNRFRKGDPLGFFMFGGSDIVLLFSEDLAFEMTAESGKQILTGREYGRTAK